jgi:membrane protein
MDVLAADQVVFLAGAVAYQFFFAIIPLLALAIGVLGFIYGSERAVNELSAALGQIYPGSGSEELAVVRQLSEGRALALGLGLLGTIVTVTTIHGALDASLAAVLGRSGERTFVRGKLEAFAFAGGLLLLAIPSVVLSAGAEALRGPIASVTAFAFFYLTYRVVPRVAVGPRAAMVGALVATILWEVAKMLFGAYTQFLGAFAAYGSLAFVAGVLTWIYLTALIILLGAEAVKLARSIDATR